MQVTNLISQNESFVSIFNSDSTTIPTTTGSEKKNLTPSSRITEEGFTDANLSCGVTIRQYLEDHPRTCKWVGSHEFISHVHSHLEGELPNLTGMILHVWYCNNMWCVLYFFGIPSILDIWWHMFGYLDICFIGVLFLLLACCAWLHLAYNQKTTVKQGSPIHLSSTIESFIIQLSILISFAWCTLSTMKAPCQHPLQHKNPSKDLCLNMKPFNYVPSSDIKSKPVSTVTSEGFFHLCWKVEPFPISNCLKGPRCNIARVPGGFLHRALPRYADFGSWKVVRPKH